MYLPGAAMWTVRAPQFVPPPPSHIAGSSAVFDAATLSTVSRSKFAGYQGFRSLFVPALAAAQTFRTLRLPSSANASRMGGLENPNAQLLLVTRRLML